MPRHPIPDNGREFSHLEIESGLIERSVAQEILVKANIAVRPSAWIEAAIETHLQQGIQVLADLRIQEKRQARIKKEFVVLENQARRTLFDIISLQVQQQAQVGANESVGGLQKERIIQC